MIERKEENVTAVKIISAFPIWKEDLQTKLLTKKMLVETANVQKINEKQDFPFLASHSSISINVV